MCPSPTPGPSPCEGKNPAVLAVEMLNPYNGIDATRNERHLIATCRASRSAEASSSISSTTSQDRERPFQSVVEHEPKLCRSGRWPTARRSSSAGPTGNTSSTPYCFGYNVGYRFIQTKAGVCHGNFLGIGADDCYTAAAGRGRLRPDGSAHHQWRIRLLPRPGPDHDRRDRDQSRLVRFVNCAYWGPCNRSHASPGRAPWASATASSCSGTARRRAVTRCKSRAEPSWCEAASSSRTSPDQAERKRSSRGHRATQYSPARRGSTISPRATSRSASNVSN